MNRHFSYLPEFSRLVQACSRLRDQVRAGGRDVAAFHVPARTLRAIFQECKQELRDITVFGVPVYRHDGSGGLLAEKGRSLHGQRYSLEWREA